MKCSQLAANIYQSCGLMDPLINPSLVLPVDFLPPDLLMAAPTCASGGDDAVDTATTSSRDDAGAETKRSGSRLLRVGLQFHEVESENISTIRDHHAVNDEAHPHHERHKELAEAGYHTPKSHSSMDSAERVASVEAFFSGFPQFDADVVPLKVRTDGAKFAAENGAGLLHPMHQMTRV